MWGVFLFSFFQFYSESPLLAGLPGTPPERPSAQRADLFPGDPPSDRSPEGGSRNVLAGVPRGGERSVQYKGAAFQGEEGEMGCVAFGSFSLPPEAVGK